VPGHLSDKGRSRGAYPKAFLEHAACVLSLEGHQEREEYHNATNDFGSWFQKGALQNLERYFRLNKSGKLRYQPKNGDQVLEPVPVEHYYEIAVDFLRGYGDMSHEELVNRFKDAGFFIDPECLRCLVGPHPSLTRPPKIPGRKQPPNSPGSKALVLRKKDGTSSDGDEDPMEEKTLAIPDRNTPSLFTNCNVYNIHGGNHIHGSSGGIAGGGGGADLAGKYSMAMLVGGFTFPALAPSHYKPFALSPSSSGALSKLDEMHNDVKELKSNTAHIQEGQQRVLEKQDSTFELVAQSAVRPTKGTPSSAKDANPSKEASKVAPTCLFGTLSGEGGGDGGAGVAGASTTGTLTTAAAKTFLKSLRKPNLVAFYGLVAGNTTKELVFDQDPNQMKVGLLRESLQELYGQDPQLFHRIKGEFEAAQRNAAAAPLPTPARTRSNIKNKSVKKKG